MKTYSILTFGCQMNLADSEIIAGELENLGFVRANSFEDSTIIVLNTCAIRDTAEQKILGKIGSFKKWKKQSSGRILAVGGCMTAQKERAEFVAKTYPFVDIVFGTENLSNFTNMLDAFLKTGKRQIQMSPENKTQLTKNQIRERRVNAWVNIMHGCNNYCSYCIVPYVRGRETSRDRNEIISEVKSLVKGGYKQITLLGQNVNSYGNDNPEKFGDFSSLLKELDEIQGDFRIRFMSSHPKDLSEELVKTIADSKHICHGIHLPVQSGSTSVLKLMNRKYTREDYIKKIQMIRNVLPDCEITSDVIVGFPGETEEDFEETISLAKEVKFISLFMFVYSRRKGTVADKMEQIDESVKKDRIKRLISAENKIAAEVAKSLVGKTLRLLIEGYDEKEDAYVGMTDSAKAVFVKSNDNIIGKFINAKITKSVGSKLFANA